MAVNPMLRTATAFVAAVLATAGLAVAEDSVSTGQTIANNVPGLIRAGKNVGATNAAQIIDVVIWLQDSQSGRARCAGG